MHVAYLVNQYPKVSHAFVRREILALEKQGVRVSRFSIRATASSDLVDADDLAELSRTEVVLNAGAFGLLSAFLSTLLNSPWMLMKTLRLAVQCGRNSHRGILRHLIYVLEACLLQKWLQADGCQHLHAHFGTNPTTVAMLCHSLGGPPYSFTVHGPDEFDRPEMIRLGEKIARAAFVVAITSFCRSQLYRWCDYQHWPKIHVVHCGVDAKFLASEPPAIEETRQLVSIGRLSGQKGQMLLLDAAAALAKEGMTFRLVLVGDGELRPQLETMIRDHNLHDHAFLAGVASADQVRQHLLDSRALCLPSFAEGLPVVVMESLALARPVISTYIAGHPELMETGQTGWLIPAGSVDALIEAMRAALQATQEDLNRMGQEGRRRVMESHSIDKEARKLKALFEATAPQSCSL